jgi:hypothetical protein
VTVTFTWTLGNNTVGTITSTGLFTASVNGTTTVTATSGSISGIAIVSVGLVLDPADSDGNRIISMPELITVIGNWKTGTYSMPELIRTIGRWKEGGY